MTIEMNEFINEFVDKNIYDRCRVGQLFVTQYKEKTIIIRITDIDPLTYQYKIE